jgi:uncharacterized phage protein gp47/JayE
VQLNLKTFSTLVQDMAAAVQAASSEALNLAVGSTLRAVLEANASIGLWLQWLIVQVLQATRASTSEGPDLDSWVADFGLSRMPAVAATGTVTFSRAVPTMAAFVPVGATVKTSDFSQTFAIVADETNPSWETDRQGYVLPSGSISLQAPVRALAPGKAGNVQSGAISLIAAAIPGVDAVANQNPLANGRDSEADEALRDRFKAFLGSLSRATSTAIEYAVASVRQGLNFRLQENVDASGAPRNGSFLLTVDDGSGAPSGQLLAAIRAAVDAIRPVGSAFAVQGPVLIPATIALSLKSSSAAMQQQVTQNVVQAVQGFVSTLPIGGTLPITRLAQVAYQADRMVANVSQIQVNNGNQDLIPPPNGVIRPNSVVVSWA